MHSHAQLAGALTKRAAIPGLLLVWDLEFHVNLL